MDFVILAKTYLKDSVMHFWFSGLAGCLAFCLTATILYAVSRMRRGGASLAPAQNYFILGLALLSAFFAAWSAHLCLDMFTDWWTTPLGLPLIILK
jgi:hypothetical protein